MLIVCVQVWRRCESVRLREQKVHCCHGTLIWVSRRVLQRLQRLRNQQAAAELHRQKVPQEPSPLKPHKRDLVPSVRLHGKQIVVMKVCS